MGVRELSWKRTWLNCQLMVFYVNVVNQRWWDIFCKIPSTDNLAMYVSNSIHGQVITLRIFYGYIMDIFPSYYLMTALYLQDERCRLMRRTIMRYANLSYVMRRGRVDGAAADWSSDHF